MSFKSNLRKIFNILTPQKGVAYPVEITEEEVSLIERCKPFTMTSIERLYATMSSTKYIINNGISGSLVECGVWRGGNSMIMAHTLLSMGVKDRDIYLFDTFEGMTEPSSLDRDTSGKLAKDQLDASKKREGDNIWCLASLEDVQDNFAGVGYPSNLLHYIKGDVQDTLDVEVNLPEEVSLLRLDTDWYESTKKELDVLFPRLVKGGVCLIDDYGHWQGARKALDDYLAEHKLYPLIHVTDYTGRVFIKTS